ncbi:MAG: ankyrin repeat domain-containing protein [Gemmataceae bacterium]
MSATQRVQKPVVLLLVLCFVVGLTLLAALGYLLFSIMQKESLHWAATKGDIRELESILDHHPEWIENRNRLDCTPLLTAVMKGQLDAAKALLARGANVNATWNLVSTDEGNWTVLHIAANWRRIEFLDSLVQSGANVNAISVQGETPCDVAFRNGDWDMLDALHKLGGLRGDEIRKQVK